VVPDLSVRLALSIVHPGTVAYGWHESVLKTLRASQHDISIISIHSGPLISRARNKALELFLETDAEYLLSTDSDIVWEPEAIDRLLAVNKDIVSAAYYGHSFTEGSFPVMSVKHEGKLSRPQDFPDTDIEPVFGVGMGFCLIKRKVIQDLAPIKKLWPFAEVEYGKDEAIGEDLTFCMRAAKKGHASFLLPRVRVGHMKQVTI
jgi:glycosyltransferase involved in cell wall biosynthesis